MRSVNALVKEVVALPKLQSSYLKKGLKSKTPRLADDPILKDTSPQARALSYVK